jgi:hypothetical protein
MKIGDIQRVVISNYYRKDKKMQQVVYKTYLGKHGGKAKFGSQTRHELAK